MRPSGSFHGENPTPQQGSAPPHVHSTQGFVEGGSGEPLSANAPAPPPPPAASKRKSLSLIPASSIRNDIDAMHTIINTFRTGGGATHPFCCIFLISGSPGASPVWELVEGASGPNDNVVMMPFRHIIWRMMSYDPMRPCNGVQGPVSFAHGGMPTHDPTVARHWIYTTSIFMLLVCESVERMSIPAREALLGLEGHPGGGGATLGCILEEWRMEAVRRASAIFGYGEWALGASRVGDQGCAGYKQGAPPPLD